MDVKMRTIGKTAKIASSSSQTILAEPSNVGDTYLIYNVFHHGSNGIVTFEAFKTDEDDIVMFRLPGEDSNNSQILNCTVPFEWPPGYGMKCNDSNGGTVVYQMLKG